MKMGFSITECSTQNSRQSHWKQATFVDGQTGSKWYPACNPSIVYYIHIHIIVHIYGPIAYVSKPCYLELWNKTTAEFEVFWIGSLITKGATSSVQSTRHTTSSSIGFKVQTMRRDCGENVCIRMNPFSANYSQCPTPWLNSIKIGRLTILPLRQDL